MRIADPIALQGWTMNQPSLNKSLQHSLKF